MEEGEGNTVLVDYSSNFEECLPEHHIYIATSADKDELGS
jgi:hypothetical protein